MQKGLSASFQKMYNWYNIKVNKQFEQKLQTKNIINKHFNSFHYEWSANVKNGDYGK